ncbi:rhomboid family intramembrane serine protease [Aquibium sp. ELW1220]|jgi:membrane associated rhomboid family serine protease|uniref:rhomboid family intramembrane serine protease n=1 Tax=Aquibium sp. ELW1220 TaxID=2976766 RepID=UPI0025AF294B|nr:rhomboid family intramembrane serine protease [Aquibium sp. ELW1220]MDN2579788.1 rhomboid family intramembrane serine protease [Aquibium sp. ELW1220]
MFIPLHDANSLKHIRLQYITLGIIAANVIIFFLMAIDPGSQATVYGLGYVPAIVHDVAELPPHLVLVPEGFTYVTYAFLHGDFFHLAGNMLFLWVFGDNVEDALGHFRFFLFYLACAAAGAAFHGILAPGSEIPLVGASGAIAGIVAAYLILHPRVKVWVLAFGRIPLRIPAFIPLILWVGFQMLMLTIGDDSNISWATHVGGILCGAILIVILKRPEVPLFDRRIVTPVAVETVEAEPAPSSRPRTRWGRQ